MVGRSGGDLDVIRKACCMTRSNIELPRYFA